MSTKTKRQELIARMQSILADSEAGLTAEQQKEFDRCKAQIDLMDVSGSDDNGVMPRKIKEGEGEINPVIPNSIPALDKSKVGWTDTQGRSIKVYGHKDKVGSGQYSVGKFVKGLLTGNWEGADIEHRLFQTTTTNSGAGAYSIPAILHQELIDLARAKSVLSAAGANIVELQPGQNKILRCIADPTAEVKVELESFNSTNPTFNLVEFQPYTIGTYVQVSQELAQDGQNFADILEQIMSAVVGAKLDYLGLRGSGSGEPTGIINTSGINTEGVDTWAYDDILDGLNELQKDNCNTANSYILSPTTNNSLVKLKETSTGAYLVPPTDVQKLNKFITTSMANEDLVVGDFSNLYLGLRQGITFETSPVADDSFKKFALAFRVVMRADWQLVRPNHFCLCSQNIS